MELGICENCHLLQSEEFPFYHFGGDDDGSGCGVDDDGGGGGDGTW